MVTSEEIDIGSYRVNRGWFSLRNGSQGIPKVVENNRAHDSNASVLHALTMREEEKSSTTLQLEM